MPKWTTIILTVFFLLGANIAYAKEVPSVSSSATVISMTHEQVLDFAKELMVEGKLDDARKALLVKPYNVKKLEIERLYLLAQIATIEHKYDEAIDLYYFILDYQPDIPNIRFKLAELLLLKKELYRSEYHFRLALANKDLPPEVQKKIKMALYYIRQNRNWNAWFNFGVAPDNNINNTTSGEQCIMTDFGVLCNTLDEPEKDVGFNITAGGDYEYKLSNQWRLRNEFLVYNSKYSDKKYDDTYLTYAVGPKYVYNRGDVFVAATTSKRYLGHEDYNYSLGLKLETNYDFTRQLSGNLQLHYTPTYYDEYKDILDGDVKGARARLVYMLDSSKYLVFRTGYELETTKDSVYTNYRTNYAIGFGAEMPYGFHAYLEPSLLYTNYKGERWVVKDYDFVKLKEESVITRYSISLSNRNISVWGLVPTLTYSYTDKSSNIWQNEYQKSLIEFSISKKF